MALILISAGKEQRVKAESRTGGFPSLRVGRGRLRARSTSPAHRLVWIFTKAATPASEAAAADTNGEFTVI